ncbi:MCM DNA helicase complex subunit, partial [Spiromyces aspiralis]
TVSANRWFPPVPLSLMVVESSPRLGANDLPSTPFPMTPGGLPSTPGFHFPNTPGLRSNGQLGSSQFSFLSSQSGEAIVGGGSQHQSSSLGNTTVRRRADLGSSSSILRGGRASIALGSSGGGSKRGNAALSSELGSENGRIATGGTPNEGDDEEEEEEELRVIWGTVVNIQDVVTKFRKFLLGFTTRHWVEYLEKQQGQGREESRPAALAGAEDEPLYTRLLDQMRQGEIRYLNLNARHLLALPESAKLYRLLVNYPEEVIPILDHVLTETYIHRFPDEYYDPDNFGLRVRPFNLMEAVNMRELNPSDIDKLVSIKGLMIRASNIIPDMQVAFFRCTSCEWTVTAGIERGVITEPTKCGNPNCLMRESMELVHNRSVFTDKQICKLQETPDVIPDGQTPHTVSLVMHDELVDVAKPGDRLEVTGIYRGVPVRINPRKRTVQALYRTYIDVVHIRRSSPSRVENDPNMVTNDNEYVADLHKLGVGEEDLVGGDRSDAANSLVVTEEEEKEFK